MPRVSYFENLTEPSGLVITLNELKAWLKLDGSDEDSILTALIYTATSVVEAYCGVTLRPHNVRGNYAHLDCSRFEPYSFITFRKFPLNSISQVTYWNGASHVALTATTDYLVEQRNKAYVRVLFKTALSGINNETIAYPLRIEGSVGYATLPDVLKQAVLMYCAYLYENRGDCSDCSEDGGATIPKAIRTLLTQFKIRGVY